MCSASWEWIKLERIFGPAAEKATTAAALSSQLVSMPRTTIAHAHRSGACASRPRAPPGSAGRCYLVRFEGLVGGGIDLEQLDRIPPQCRRMLDHRAAALLFEQHAVM